MDMNMKSSIFKQSISLVLVLCCTNCLAAGIEYVGDDSVYLEKPDKISVYDKRQHIYRKNWGALIPTQCVVQFAGNMGLLSLGVGWDYGKRCQWETNLLFGYLPQFSSSRSKITMTLKENFMPWSYELGKGSSFEPLSCGIYFNTVFGHEFWAREPERYPKGYYKFSTKIRTNIFVGERVTKVISKNRRHYVKSLTLYYELSSNDLYIYTAIKNKYISLGDILSLSFGVKLQLL